MINKTLIFYTISKTSSTYSKKIFVFDEVVNLFNNYHNIDPKGEIPTVYFEEYQNGIISEKGTVTLAEDKRSLVYHYDQSCQSCQYANLYLTFCQHIERPIYPEYMNTACEYHRKLKPSKPIK